MTEPDDLDALQFLTRLVSPLDVPRELLAYSEAMIRGQAGSPPQLAPSCCSDTPAVRGSGFGGALYWPCWLCCWALAGPPRELKCAWRGRCRSSGKVATSS